MANAQIEMLAPLACPLPPAPEGEVFTPEQWRTLLSIADAIIPSVSPKSAANESDQLPIPEPEYTVAKDQIQSTTFAASVESNLASKYLGESASSIPGFKEALRRTFGHYVHEEGRKGITFILSALKSLSSLFKRAWLQLSPTLSPVVGFPRVPIHGKPGKGFDFDFIQFPPRDQTEIVETDVVIIGSGCGGGVCAKNLAEAGQRVMMVEKSYHFPPVHFPMTPGDGGIHLFQNGGQKRLMMAALSLSQVQPGAEVAPSIGLPLSRLKATYVRNGQTRDYFFTSADFQNSLDRVCHRMGVSTKYIEHNFANRALLDGARRLGYGAKDVPQNTGNSEHYDGYCSLGCGLAAKQGPAVSFLPDASRAGAHFIEGFQTNKIIFDEVDGRKVANGVQGLWISRDSDRGVSETQRVKREVIIRAKKVIVSCGTLQGPLLLLRSGLKNPQIGGNLHLHAATVIGRVFHEDIRPWEGGILTSVVYEFENLDSHGHGTKIETTAMVPSMFLPMLPWKGGLDFKMGGSKFGHMTGFVIIERDRDTGRVYPDPVDGRCRIRYTPSAFDRQNLVEGMVAAAKITYVTGAKEIFSTHPELAPFIRPHKSEDLEAPDDGINDVSFKSWIDEMRQKGLPTPDGNVIASAHQMGTCRMGSIAKNSVVDPNGKVWGTEGLYVADASVFPSASGVNPMLTNMAISDWISRSIAKDMKKQKRGMDMARL